MSETPARQRTDYAGGPLDLEPAGRPTSIYRTETGQPLRAAAGDRRACYDRWQPGETGIYGRRSLGYQWIPRKAAP